MSLLEALMTRLRVDRSAVTSSIDHLTVGDKGKCSAVNERVWITKTLLALLVSASLVTAPVWAAPSSSLGIVVYADRAQVGSGQASVGATVFSGDRLSTAQSGGVQIRARHVRPC